METTTDPEFDAIETPADEPPSHLTTTQPLNDHSQAASLNNSIRAASSKHLIDSLAVRVLEAAIWWMVLVLLVIAPVAYIMNSLTSNAAQQMNSFEKEQGNNGDIPLSFPDVHRAGFTPRIFDNFV